MTTPIHSAIAIAVGQIRIMRLAQRSRTPAEVTEDVERRYGWPAVHGTVAANGTAIDHHWNVLPDGTILDSWLDRIGGDTTVAHVSDPAQLASYNGGDGGAATTSTPATNGHRPHVTPAVQLDEIPVASEEPTPIPEPEIVSVTEPDPLLSLIPEPDPADEGWSLDDDSEPDSVPEAVDPFILGSNTSAPTLEPTPTPEPEPVGAQEPDPLLSLMPEPTPAPDPPAGEFSLEDLGDPPAATPGPDLPDWMGNPSVNDWSAAPPHAPTPQPVDPSVLYGQDPTPSPDLSGWDPSGGDLSNWQGHDPLDTPTAPEPAAPAGYIHDPNAPQALDEQDLNALVGMFGPRVPTSTIAVPDRRFRGNDDNDDDSDDKPRRRWKPKGRGDKEPEAKEKTPKRARRKSKDTVEFSAAADDNDSDPEPAATVRRGLRPVLLGAAVGMVAIGALPVIGYATGAYYFVPVESGSMQPAIGVGDLAIARPVNPDSVKEGDVIVFDAPINDSPRVIHRVVKVTEVDGHPTAVTKGDNNDVPDPWTVNLDSGEVWRSAVNVPFAGYLFSAAENPLVRGASAALAAGSIAALAIAQTRGRKPAGSTSVTGAPAVGSA